MRVIRETRTAPRHLASGAAFEKNVSKHHRACVRVCDSRQVIHGWLEKPMCVSAGGCVALELAKEGIWGCAGQCDTPVLFHGGASFSVEERMACMYDMQVVLLLVTSVW